MGILMLADLIYSPSSDKIRSLFRKHWYLFLLVLKYYSIKIKGSSYLNFISLDAHYFWNNLISYRINCSLFQHLMELFSYPDNYQFKHPLEHTWTLWYLDSNRTKNWEDCLMEVGSFGTVEDFWWYAYSNSKTMNNTLHFRNSFRINF